MGGFFFVFLKKHYAPVSQANWCNMTFTVSNLFPSHSCIGWPKSSCHWDSNPGPQLERPMTYQLSYPSPWWTGNSAYLTIILFYQKDILTQGPWKSGFIPCLRKLKYWVTFSELHWKPLCQLSILCIVSLEQKSWSKSHEIRYWLAVKIMILLNLKKPMKGFQVST